MLKSLYLKNWKSHKETTIEFSKGANVLVGNIGAGKTSIVEGIAFCLFGTTQSVVSKSISIKDLITQKPNKETEASLVLELEIDENTYKIERHIFETKSSQARIYCNDLLIAGPKPQDVNKKIEELFFVNFDLFMRANYSEQNQLDFFVRIQPRERKIIFDNVFGIDIFESLEKNSKQVLTRLKDKSSTLKESLLLNEKTLESFNYLEIQSQIKALDEKIKSSDAELEIFLKTADIEKKVVLELKEKENKFTEINSKLSVISGQIINLSKIISETEVTTLSLSELQNKYASEKDDYEKLKTIKIKKESLALELALFEKQESEFKTKIQNIKSLDLEKLQEQKKDYEKNKKELYLELQQKKGNYEFRKQKLLSNILELDKYKPIIEKLASLKNIEKEFKDLEQKYIFARDATAFGLQTKESLESEIKILEKGDHDCPLCGSELTKEHYLELSEKKKNQLKTVCLELDKIKKEEGLIKNQKQEKEKDYLYFLENKQLLEKDYSLIDREKEEQVVIFEDVKQLEKKVQEQEIELEKLSSNLFAVQQLNLVLEKKAQAEKLFGLIIFDNSLLVEKEKSLKTLEKQIEQKKYANNLLDLEKQKTALEENLKELKFNKKELSDLEQKYYELLSKISSVSENQEFSKKTKRDLDKQERTILEFKTKIDKEKEKQVKQSLVLEDVSLFNVVAKKTQEDLRKRIIEKINIIFAELWKQIYPYEDFKQVEIIVKDGDYKIEISFNNHKRDLDSFVSGGERSLIALCLRIAISLSMQNKLDIIILDEPTHNLDKNSITSLASMINDVLPKYIGQIIIITHDDVLSSYSDNVAVIKRNKDTDAASFI